MSTRRLWGLYATIPKAVFAAVAVSALTVGGDDVDEARELVVVVVGSC
jgi:hypothetical protein